MVGLVVAGLALVGFLFFLAWEPTEKNPIVDLRLFARRNFWLGTVSLSVAYGVFFGNVVLMPLWLQQWMGYTATNAGMALAPVGVFAILLSPLVGRKVSVWDPRRMATGAFIVFALVLWMRSQFTTQTALVHVLIPTFIGVTFVAFILIRLVPGDPVELLVGERGVTPERHAQLMAQLGLDKPFWAQYAGFLDNLVLHGDLGRSINTREPVPRPRLASRFCAPRSSAKHRLPPLSQPIPGCNRRSAETWTTSSRRP